MYLHAAGTGSLLPLHGLLSARFSWCLRAGTYQICNFIPNYYPFLQSIMNYTCYLKCLNYCILFYPLVHARELF